MTVEQSIEQGNFREALTALTHETSGPGADPGRLLMRFNMEVRLQRFAEAATTMQRLVAAAPQLSAPMAEFSAAAQAEAQATARLRDPALGGRRKAVGMPAPYALALTKAAVFHAQGDARSAAAAIQEAKAATPPISGTLVRVDGHPQRFSAITDTDDLTGATVPLYREGEVFDLPLADLRSLVFSPPKTSFDVMWAPVEVTTTDGQRFYARLPSLYPGTGLAAEAPIRSGQMTAWSHDRGYAVALGQRDWSLTVDGGQVLMGLTRVARVDFENAPRMGMPGPGPAYGHGAPPGMPYGHPSPLAAGVQSLAGITVIALGARAALPALARFTGMLGLPFIGYEGYDALKGLVGLAGIILYLVWFARLYGWVRQTRGGTAYSTGLAIGGWFIPFVNFVLPYRALNDAATRTVGAPLPLVGVWWGAYLLSMFLQVFYSLMRGGIALDLPPAVFELLGWVNTLSQVVAWGAWAKLVRDLSARVR